MTRDASTDPDAGSQAAAGPDGNGGGDDEPGQRPDGSDGSADGPRVPDPNEYLDRRTLVKLLIALAFGIPLLVEGVTFLRLLESRLLGDGDDDDAGTTATSEPAGVGVGDDLLAGTPQADTVESMAVDPGEDAWTFSMTVLVENDVETGERYQLRLTSVTGNEGTTVANEVATDRLAPGESDRITGSWALATGERPETVRAVAVTVPEGGTASTTAEDVELARVPVQR